MEKLNTLTMLEELICAWFKFAVLPPPTNLADFANKTVTRIRVTEDEPNPYGVDIVQETTKVIPKLFPNVRTITIDAAITEEVRQQIRTDMPMGIVAVFNDPDAGIHLGRYSQYFQDYWKRIREEVVARIWEFLDGIRAGRFIVDPSERLKTCRFCDYGAVCRYDRDRIDRKKKSV